MSILKFYNFVNEAVGDKKLYLKIKEDTDNYLAYFIDEGYQVSCNNELRWIVVYIEHKNANVLRDNNYQDLLKLTKPIIWSEVKDDILAYLEVMCEKYDIQYLELYDYLTNKHKIFKIEELEKLKEYQFKDMRVVFNKRWKK